MSPAGNKPIGKDCKDYHLEWFGFVLQRLTVLSNEILMIYYRVNICIAQQYTITNDISWNYFDQLSKRWIAQVECLLLKFICKKCPKLFSVQKIKKLTKNNRYKSLQLSVPSLLCSCLI